MNQLLSILNTIAPTVASALGGPLAGVAVAAIGKVLGVDNATTESLGKAVADGKLTPENIAEIRKLELQYQNDEQERGFKYADLAFRDRDSARQANVTGGIQKDVFILSLMLLSLTLGSEMFVLFHGYPDDIPEIIVGRVLGLMDAVAMVVLNYTYGTTAGSQRKDILLANSVPSNKS